MIREERAVAVRKAIAELPKKQRATLILRTYHDMSHQQIADVLGSSVGAVKANFFHALANLKKILGIGTMTHLTPDELIDAMEGCSAADRQAHLATCDECRAQLADLSSVLSEAKQASVPEPSPLFWQHFSQRVRTAIDRGRHRAAATGRRGCAGRCLLPLGAVAMIILALDDRGARSTQVRRRTSWHSQAPEATAGT